MATPAVRALVFDEWGRAGLEPPADLLALRCGERAAPEGASPVRPGAGGEVDQREVPVTTVVRRSRPGPSPTALDLAHRLGSRYEQQLDAGSRAAGAHYTPADVAHGLTRLVITGEAGRSIQPTVWDPACGGGAFLLAAADALSSQGFEPARIVTELLWGTDTDPGAVAVTEAALVLWATLMGAPDARPGPHLATADSLRTGAPLDGDGFSYVLGNPPFQGQMTGGSVRSRADREELRERWGELVGAYTDTSTLFLAAGASALAVGGRIGMILPTSVLSARDARAARERLDRTGAMVGLWVATEPVFEAAVDVCAPVFVRRGTARVEPPTAKGPDLAAEPPVQRWRRRSFDRLSTTLRSGRRWSDLALAAIDVPSPRFESSGSMVTVALASSGFRDEYYGLVGSVMDLPAGEAPPSDTSDPVGGRLLVTSGAIDPGRCHWGERPVRFAKRTYRRPVVDGGALAIAATRGGPAARAQAWTESTRGPKVVVATQTKVGEAAVDEQGTWLPSTPTIVLRAVDGAPIPGSTEVEKLWALAAVVCSPVGSVAALADSFGSGRTSHALKPTAGSVLDLPLPVDPHEWARGAAALRSHDRDRFASAMAAAYAVAREDVTALEAWWTTRAPW